MKSLFVSFIILLVSITSHAQTLFPGDAAPAITVGEWVKGNPVNSFQNNNIYVVEFWATWCGPCKVSIPHLTKLAKEYKDKVTIIGVSIAETNTANVAPFVEKMGDKMDYTVAFDKQESGTARKGFMSKNWLGAAGLNGIPVAFIVGKTGKIEFIGSPEQLDSALSLITTDKWQTKSFADKWKTDKEAEAKAAAKYSALKLKMKEAVKQVDTSSLYKAFDEYLVTSVNDPSNDGWSSANDMIWDMLADPNSKLIPDAMKSPAFGISWMEKLNTKHEYKVPAYMDTLAWLYYAKGDKSKALEMEQKALALIPVADPSRSEYENAIAVFNK